jgi:hypothetical protein
MKSWKLRIAAGVPGIVLVFGAASCGSSLATEDDLVSADSIPFGSRFEAARVELTPVDVTDLTDFHWTTVSVFGEGALPESVEQELGVALLRSPYHASRGLWVFCADDDIVKVVAGPAVEFIDTSTYSNEARIDDGYRAGSWAINEPSGQFVRADCAPPTPMLDFTPGQWRSVHDGSWVHFGTIDQRVNGMLPIEVLDASLECDGDTSSGGELFDGIWQYNQTEQVVHIGEDEPGETLDITLRPYDGQDWEVIALWPCGSDTRPPVWMVRE